MTPTTMTSAAETAPKSRKVYTAQEKAEYFALFEQGGMSPAGFCREMSLHETTFSLWRRQAREACLPGQGAGNLVRGSAGGRASEDRGHGVLAAASAGRRTARGARRQRLDVAGPVGLLFKTFSA